jgi:hypothetical protein
VAAAAEFLAHAANVHPRLLRAHRHPDAAVGQLFEECRDDHALDRAQGVDQALGVLGPRAEPVFHRLRHLPIGQPVPGGELHGLHQLAEQPHPLPREIVVDFRVQPADIQSAAQQVRRQFVSLGGGRRVLERPGVGGNPHVDRLAHRLGHRQAEVPDQLIDDLPGRRTARIDVIEGAVVVVRLVVVEVDPAVASGHRGQRFFAESRAVSGVEGDHDLDLPGGLVRGALDALGLGHEGEIRGHAVVVENSHPLAGGLQRQAER